MYSVVLKTCVRKCSELNICMCIVLFCENVMSLRIFERVCWLSYFDKCKLYTQVLGYVLYAAVMLPKFYKITSLEKKKKM